MSPLNILVNLIINTYFNESKCILIYKSQSEDFIYRGSLPVVVFSEEHISNYINSSFCYFGCQGFIIIASNPCNVLQILENNIKHSKDRFNFRKYLFVPHSSLNVEMSAILLTPILQYVANVLVIEEISNKLISKNKNGIYQNATTKIFNLMSLEYEGKLLNKTTVLDKWFSMNSSFAYNRNLYPNKLKNQMGKPLKIATFTYKPYSIPEPMAWESDGTEVRITLLYAKKHNMTPEMVIDEIGQWGTVYDNWSGSGIIGNLAMDKADVGLGALYTWEHEYKFLDLSKPVIRTGITMLVPAPKLAAGWITPLLSFTLTMWIAVITIYLLSTVSIFVMHFLPAKIIRLKTKTKNKLNSLVMLQNSVTTVFSMFLQQASPISRIPTNIIGKWLFGCINLFTLLIAASYNSGLSSSMTIPRFVGAIRTVQDLADSGLYWGATSDAWISSISNDTDPKISAVRNRFIIANETQLKLYMNKRFAFSIERLPGGYYAIGNYINYNSAVKYLRTLHEDLYWEQSVLMFRKSSILMPTFNDLILQIAAAGIMTHWEFTVVSKHLDSKIQNAVKYSRFHEEKRTNAEPLFWTNVEGAFLIWTLGNSLSFIILIFEIILHYTCKFDPS